jgi:putative spermidine/putrescine transport system substrate-binding protein
MMLKIPSNNLGAVTKLNATRSSRRSVLKGASVLLAAPFVFARRASAAGQVVARNPGGEYGDAMRKAYYEPFTKATGIEVLGVPASAGKLLAMVEAGNVEIDVGDITELTALVLRKRGALVPLKYESYTFSNPQEYASVRHPDMVGTNYSANCMVYNTQVYAPGKQPKSWAEFWDAKSFPGPRMLQSMNAGFPELEFALLADGVPIEKLYPIDINRAFTSLSRIKPHIAKFYETGGIQVDLLSSREVVLGSAYNGRIHVGMKKGAPVAIEWAAANTQLQVNCILKGAKNQENAQKYIDFIMQPKIQAEFSRQIPYGPTNRKAFELIEREVAQNLPNYFEDKIFYQNAAWWADNRDNVERVWNEWILK